MQNYGDILGVLKTLERGEELIHLPTRKEILSASIDERIDRVAALKRLDYAFDNSEEIHQLRELNRNIKELLALGSR